MIERRLWPVYVAGLILAALIGFLLPVVLPWSGARADTVTARLPDHHRHWCDLTGWRNLNLIQGAGEHLRLGEIAEPASGETKWRFDRDGEVIFLYRDLTGAGTGWTDYWAYDGQGGSHRARWAVSPKVCAGVDW